MANNIYTLTKIRNKQTINQNRFGLKFTNLWADILSNAENHRSYGVRERFKGVKNIVGTGDQVDTDLELGLFSVTLPNVGIETQQISRFNDSVRAPTKFTEMEDLTVSFYDYIDGSASAILQLWQSMVADKLTGAMGFKEEFVLEKTDFFVYGPDAPGHDVERDGEIPYVQHYKILNLWPKSINLGEHSYESGEARKVEVTFSVDNVVPVFFTKYSKETKKIITNDGTVDPVFNF